MAEAIFQIVNNFMENKEMFDGIDKNNIVGEWRINIPYSAYIKDTE